MFYPTDNYRCRWASALLSPAWLWAHYHIRLVSQPSRRTPWFKVNHGALTRGLWWQAWISDWSLDQIEMEDRIKPKSKKNKEDEEHERLIDECIAKLKKTSKRAQKRRRMENLQKRCTKPNSSVSNTMQIIWRLKSCMGEWLLKWWSLWKPCKRRRVWAEKSIQTAKNPRSLSSNGTQIWASRRGSGLCLKHGRVGLRRKLESRKTNWSSKSIQEVNSWLISQSSRRSSWQGAQDSKWRHVASAQKRLVVDTTVYSKVAWPNRRVDLRISATFETAVLPRFSPTNSVSPR